MPFSNGPEQAPFDYDGSRVSPDLRRALANQPSEISRHVKSVADLPATPDRGDNRPDWQQPRSNRR